MEKSMPSFIIFMKRKEYRNPIASDLRRGNILPIYIRDFMFEEGLEGKAELIKRQPSKWRTAVPYVRAEVGGTIKQAPNAINWSFQRWLVQFVDGPSTGKRAYRYIAYFLSVDKNLDSGYSHFDEE